MFNRRYAEHVPETGQEFLSYALDGVDRMRQLIHALLTYSRLGTRGKMAVLVESNGVIERVLAGLKPLIDESKATVTVEQLPGVMVDEAQLEQCCRI